MACFLHIPHSILYPMFNMIHSKDIASIRPLHHVYIPHTMKADQMWSIVTHGIDGTGRVIVLHQNSDDSN